MPAEFTITPGQIGATINAIVRDVVNQEQKELLTACYFAAIEAGTEVVRVITDMRPAPSDTGQLANSFKNVTRTPDGALLGSSAPHAAFVEFGTAPHWAPLAPLVAWAERKLRGKIPKGKKRTDAAEAWGRLIQFKIAHRGTRARHYFEMASHKFPEILQRHLAEAQARVK